MKDPDTLWDAVRDAVDEEIDKLGLEEDEATELKEIRAQKVRDKCGRWFRYGEYLDVEIDTDAGTCTVLPVGT